VYKKTKLMINS